MSHQLGRNDPCPCGSGKKYKKCCMKKDELKEREERESRVPERKPISIGLSGDDELYTEIYEAIIEPPGFDDYMEKKLGRPRSANFMENLNEYSLYADEYNTKGHPHFLGLSPNVFCEILERKASENEELLRLTPEGAAKKEILAVPLVKAVVSILGNLKQEPRLWKQQTNPPDEWRRALPGEFSKEPAKMDTTEQWAIHLLMYLLEKADWVEWPDGFFSLTPEGERVLTEDDPGAIFRTCFYICVEVVDLFSIYENIPVEFELIQRGLIYFLYMLKQKAREKCLFEKLADIFLRNFHPVARSLKNTSWSRQNDPTGILLFFWQELFLQGFCRIFGLVELDKELSMEDRRNLEILNRSKVRVSHLFKKIFKWGI